MLAPRYYVHMTEAAPEQNPGGKGPLAQNSIIPLNWKPTRAQPVPVVRCVQIKKNGDRCGSWSLRGYDKCIRHAGPGAKMPDGNVNKYREAVIEAARLRLLDASDDAVNTIQDLMQPGSGEQIRLKAATEVLDRVGIRGGFEVKVDEEVTISASDEIKKRLSQLSAGASAVQQMREKGRARAEDDSDTDIVDAELVNDDDAQLALFDITDTDTDTTDNESE